MLAVSNDTAAVCRREFRQPNELQNHSFVVLRFTFSNRHIFVMAWKSFSMSKLKYMQLQQSSTGGYSVEQPKSVHRGLI